MTGLPNNIVELVADEALPLQVPYVDPLTREQSTVTVTEVRTEGNGTVIVWEGRPDRDIPHSEGP